jgi:hypothetical protein
LDSANKDEPTAKTTKAAPKQISKLASAPATVTVRKTPAPIAIDSKAEDEFHRLVGYGVLFAIALCIVFVVFIALYISQPSAAHPTTYVKPPIVNQVSPKNVSPVGTNKDAPFSSTFKEYRGSPTDTFGSGSYYDYNYRPPVGEHYVSPHVRQNGSFVQGHYQSNPDNSFWNNWSSKGNVNPHTGKIGTRLPPISSRSHR